MPGNTLVVNPVRGLCTVCGLKPQPRGNITKNGLRAWRSRCWTCYRKAASAAPAKPPRAPRTPKSDHCDRCGYVPEHPCQLGVNRNTGPVSSPLHTLCANCHRLKTLRRARFYLSVAPPLQTIGTADQEHYLDSSVGSVDVPVRRDPERIAAALEAAKRGEVLGSDDASDLI